MSRARHPRLVRALRSRGVALLVGALIALSCSLTLVEVAAGADSPSQRVFNLANRALGLVFAIELGLRFTASNSRRRFVSEYWSDLLSLLPAIATPHANVALRLLRLLRLYRLMRLLQQHPPFTGFVVRRAPRQLFALLALVTAVVFAATTAIFAFEGGDNPSVESFRDAFWFSVYSLVANEPIPGPPHTLGGKIVSLLLVAFGVTTFAVFTGTVSAFMVERFRTEGNRMSWDELADHIVICGWNRKAEIIVQEYSRAQPGTPIVVVAQVDGDPPFSDATLRGLVQFLDDDFTSVHALEKAGIRRATTCVILSDVTHGRTERDADARTLLAALTVEKLNRDVYTCAELNRREYAPHLELGSVNSFVVSGEHSAFLLAQAAMNRNVLGVFSELLTYQTGSRFCRVRAPARWAKRSFIDAMVELKRDHDAILIAVCDDKGVRINPHDFHFVGGEETVVISARDLDLDLESKSS